MKKMYLCAIALSVGSFSFAQVNLKNAPTKAKLGVDNSEKLPVKMSNNNNKAPGDTIWSEDFTGGIPAGWTLVDNTGNGFDWVLDPGTANIVADFTNASPIASTSAGNSMLLFGDSYNSPIPASGAVDMDAYFQTSAIAINGEASVSVIFEQTFRLCCASSAALNLMVSTDPTFATNVLTVDVRGAVAINAQSADPEVTSVNISSIAGGLVGNIYLRFQGSPGASHYFWFVDDINVVESAANDLVASEAYYGSLSVPYTRIPVDQIQPIDFAMKATNVGGTDQAGTVLTADVNSGLFTGTSTPQTVLIGATDSLFTTGQWTPPTVIGTPYTVSLAVASTAGTDATPSNNAASFSPLEVSQYIYAMDDYSATPGNGGGDDGNAPGSFEFEAGNVYDIVTAATAHSIDVVIGTNTVVGTGMEVVLYDLTTGSFVEVDRSTPIAIASGDLGTLMSTPLPNTPTLIAGNTYFAAVHALGGTEFFYGTSGTSQDNTAPGGAVSFIFYPDMQATTQNYFTSQTPMVRLNFDPGTVGINSIENATSFNVYPNPSTGEFNINLNNDMGSAISLTVKNVVGQMVINKEIAINGNQVETISLAGYDKGIYFLTINNETVKLIVE